jgi:hypothetical protein
MPRRPRKPRFVFFHEFAGRDPNEFAGPAHPAIDRNFLHIGSPRADTVKHVG